MTPLRRIEFASSDPLEIRDFLHRVRGSQARLNGTRDRGWRVSLTQVSAGAFSSSEMRLPGDITFRMSGRDEVVIHTILGGRSRLDHGQASHRYQSGDAYVASCPRVDFTCRTHEIRTRTVTLPQSLLTEVASVTPDPPSRPWEFVPFAPATGGVRQWLNITCAGSVSTRPTASSRRPTRITIPSPRWPSGGASAARAGSPPTTAGAYGVPPSQTLRQ